MVLAAAAAFFSRFKARLLTLREVCMASATGIRISSSTLLFFSQFLVGILIKNETKHLPVILCETFTVLYTHMCMNGGRMDEVNGE